MGFSELLKRRYLLNIKWYLLHKKLFHLFRTIHRLAKVSSYIERCNKRKDEDIKVVKYVIIKASEMLVAPPISECFGLPWSALVCYSLPWSAIVCLGCCWFSYFWLGCCWLGPPAMQDGQKGQEGPHDFFLRALWALRPVRLPAPPCIPLFFYIFCLFISFSLLLFVLLVRLVCLFV